MNREEVFNYLRSCGLSEEQIKAIEGAFSCPSAGIDCGDCLRECYKVLPSVRAESEGE